MIRGLELSAPGPPASAEGSWTGIVCSPVAHDLINHACSYEASVKL